MQVVSGVLKALREDGGLAKNPYAKKLVGHEVVGQTLEATWPSNHAGIREASAIISWCASSSARLGTTSGVLVRDVKMDIASASTGVTLPQAGGTKRVQRLALRTKVKVFTSKHESHSAKDSPGVDHDR
ncbi:unnamed protein product [Pylaiella littoralis]